MFMKEDCGLLCVRLVGMVGKKVAHQHGRRWVSSNGTLSWPKHFGPRDLNQRSWRSWSRVGKRSRGEHAVQLEQLSRCRNNSESTLQATTSVPQIKPGCPASAAHPERPNCSDCPTGMPKESAASGGGVQSVGLACSGACVSTVSPLSKRDACVSSLAPP